MGCGSSNAVSTSVEPSNRPTAAKVNTKQGKDGVADNNPDISRDTNNVTNSSPSTSITNVNNSSGKPREISAASTRTADSGIISELEEGEILTENSRPDKISNVRAAGRPCTPELFLEGRACQRLQSGKEKRRTELENKNSESNIRTLPPLAGDDSSWLERPKTRGIYFNIGLFPETGNVKKAPANLAKLERRKRGKKLTKEELDEKMSRAMERRKEHERKIVEKSQAFIASHGNTKLQAQAEKDDHDNSERQHETSWKDQDVANEIECL